MNECSPVCDWGASFYALIIKVSIPKGQERKPSQPLILQMADGLLWWHGL